MAQYFLSFLGGYYTWGYIGFLIGSPLAARNLTRNGLSFTAGVAIVTAGIYGGLFGARLLFLLQYDWNFLLSHWWQTFVFWQGGLSWLGGPLGSAIVFLVVFRILRRDVWKNMGSIAPGLALAHSIARTGCLIRGCCYGKPTSVPWAIYSDVLQTYVHPTQVYSMAAELCTAAFLQALHRREDRRKYLFPFYLLLLSVNRIILECFRGDAPGPGLIGGLRFYQSVSVLILAASLAIMLAIWKGKNSVPAVVAVLLAVSALFFASKPEQRREAQYEASSGKQYLVLTREMFRQPLQQWKEWRERQGWQIDLVAWPDAPTRDQLRTCIRAHAKQAVTSVLIVGDCASESESGAAWDVPSDASPDSSPVDSTYGDLDGDAIPDIPLGRLPVRSESQLNPLLDKLRRYEERFSPVTERPRLLLWVHVGDRKELVDTFKSRLNMYVPQTVSTMLVDGANAAEESRVFLESLARPCNLSAIVSHGNSSAITSSGGPSGQSILTIQDVRNLASNLSSGPMFIFACKSGLFNAPEADGCLAENLLLHPGGPVAVIATGAPVGVLSNYALALKLGVVLKGPPTRTAGDLFLSLQKNAAEERLDQLVQTDSIAAAIAGQSLPIESHRFKSDIVSYSLLGDPGTPVFIGQQ